jgi:hypothetical protein
LVFGKTEDSDFKGHALLEQYAAQVSSALRPAFTPQTPPDITAEACKVLSIWIASNVQKSANDLSRVHELLVHLLTAIEQPPNSSYNERATTMLRLSLLTSYATLYIESETSDAKPVCLFSLFPALIVAVHQSVDCEASRCCEPALAVCPARLCHCESARRVCRSG